MAYNTFTFVGLNQSQMKNIIITLFAAATFTACNNAPAPTTVPETTAVEPAHDANMDMPVVQDTTAIMPNQKVFFPNLKEGQTIKLPFILKFGVEGMEVKPAMGVEPNVGHHHIMIDHAALPANTMFPMQKETEGYYHFGKGQLQDTLSLKKYQMLTPGMHTITLQFGNSVHMSYGPAMSKTLTVNVK